MNKTTLIAAIALTLSSAVNAQGKLTIIEQDYALAKRTAAKEQKLLIVDFYTTWCVPCKLLDKAVFQQDSIASRIGENFVLLKYDAEKDAAHNLSLKHHVASYPTTIVTTADGKVVQKMFGLGNSRDSLVQTYTRFLEVSISLNRAGKFITGYAPETDTTVYPEFYKKYVRGIANIRPGDLDSFWKHNKHLNTEVSFDILAYFGRAPEEVTESFIKRKAEFEARYGKADVRFIINNIAGEKFSAAVEAKDEAGYEAAVQFARQHLAAGDLEAYIQSYKAAMLTALGKWAEAVETIAARIRLNTISDNGINAFCWSIYEQCNDGDIIRQAAAMMKVATDNNPSFAALDTYARLLAKSGDKEGAVAAMKRAIETGKTNGEDTKDSEAALSKF